MVKATTKKATTNAKKAEPKLAEHAIGQQAVHDTRRMKRNALRQLRKAERSGDPKQL